MCEHCGCRGVPPIAELMDEHRAMLEIGGDIRRALDAGDTTTAQALIDRLTAVLAPHVEVEEQGIFAAMRADLDFVDHVHDLSREHADLDALALSLDPARPEALRHFLDALEQHMAKEDLGLFPVAVVSLDAAGWDRVTAAHEARANALPA